MRYSLPALITACLLIMPMVAEALEITRLDAVPSGGAEHVFIHFNARAHASLQVPDDGGSPRILVDVPAATLKIRNGLPTNYRGRIIKDVKFSAYDSRTSRFVFYTSQRIKVANLRIVWPKRKHTSFLEFDIAPYNRPVMVTPAVSPFSPVMPEHGYNRQISRKSEVVRERPVIVIDAGHGGQDPGTSGYAGTEEKNVTLSFAHALENALLATGRYKVFLTRSDDHYLFLRERVYKARKAGGNLFISLHADSAPTRNARGLSVYTISETASDKESAALAAKENKADVIGGMDLSGASEDVADILIDLARRETRAKSARFADLVIRYLHHEVNLLSNTHRFAGFAVLKAPDIPSVLVEVGFLTTPSEEKMLKSQQYQTRVVQSLTRAVDAYFGRRKS